MKKRIFTLLGVMAGIGLTSYTFAGAPNPSVGCGEEEDFCIDSTSMELSLKCYGWTGTASVDIGLSTPIFTLSSSENCDIEADVDSFKQELKCEDGGNYVEAEVKESKNQPGGCNGG